MESIKSWLEHRKTDEKSSLILLLEGYFFLIVACFLLLLLPICQSTSNTLIDHLLFAVSIVSTTGLAPANFAESYNFLGQLISLFFIQLGGIGYMALSTFIIFRQFDKLPSLPARLLRLEFNLPQKYPLISFIYSVFVFTILIETIGAVILYFGFKEAGVDNPIWQSIFHSISAFCTAGFSLQSESMTSFQDNDLVTTTILILSLLGSIGFIVLFDFWLRITRKRKKITLTSKVILISTFVLWILAAVMLYFSDTDLRIMGVEGFKISVFQSISAHTTVGFNNYDIGSISAAGVYIILILMIIGASPAGTGGGIKTTSITALIAVLNAVLKRKKHITFLGKEIPSHNIYMAVSSLIFYTSILIIGTWLILVVEGDKFILEKIAFEVSSALSTVGLSTGITGELSNFSKIIICFMMFIGRLGVLTFGFVLITEAPLMRYKPEIEDIAI